jgi:hypothetical protein
MSARPQDPELLDGRQILDEVVRFLTDMLLGTGT